MPKRFLSMNLAFLETVYSHVRIPLYGNAYALMLSTAIMSSLGLIYWILAARYYPTDVVGLNVAVVSVMIFLAEVAQLPFHSVMIRFIPTAGGATNRLVGSSYLISAVVATTASAVFLFGVEFWSPALGFLRANPWLILWFTLGTLGWCIFALQDNVLTGLRQAIYVPLENFIYAITKVGLLVVFAAPFAAYGIFASWTLPSLALILPINFLIFRRLIPIHTGSSADRAVPIKISQLVSYVAGNSLGSLFLLMSIRLLPVMVIHEAGASANAYFYLPWTITFSLKLITVNMATSLTVEGASDETKLHTYSYRALVQITMMLVPIMVALLIGAPYILRLPGTSYATEGSTLLRLLTLATLPHIINSLYLGIARVQHRIAGIILVQGIISALALGLSYLFLPVYGITGVGYAVLASEIIVAVVLLCTRLRSIIHQIISHKEKFSELHYSTMRRLDGKSH